MEKNDPMVDHPVHYNEHPSGIETIKITRHLMGNLANAYKYVMRAPYKGKQMQDLEKALWYLMDELEKSPVVRVTPTVSVLGMMDEVRKAERDDHLKGFYNCIQHALKSGSDEGYLAHIREAYFYVRKYKLDISKKESQSDN